MSVDTKITVIRAQHSSENPYFMMARRVAQNRSLTWEARGLLAYLLSQPDDWSVIVADLQQQCGRDKVYRILSDLEQAGHLRREQARRDDGTLDATVYRVYEHPQPLPEKPYTAEPYTANPPLHNTDSTKKKSNKTNAANAAGGPPASPKKAAGSSRKASKTPPKVPAKGSPTEPKVQPHVALIEGWHYLIPQEIRPIGEPNYSRNVRVAQEMVEAGITLYDVVRYMALTYDGYAEWARKNKKPAVMPLEHVKTYIKDFLVESKTNGQATTSFGQTATPSSNNGRSEGVLGASSARASRVPAGAIRDIDIDDL